MYIIINAINSKNEVQMGIPRVKVNVSSAMVVIITELNVQLEMISVCNNCEKLGHYAKATKKTQHYIHPVLMHLFITKHLILIQHTLF